MSALSRGRLVLGFFPLCSLSLACLNTQSNGVATSAAPVASKEPALDAEPWASQPTGSWPQIVLTNEATFAGHTPLEGASSFLVRARDGRIHGVTARHLIKIAGGVEPPMEPAELPAALRAWWVYPRTKSEVAIQLVRDAADDGDGKALDVLLLPVKDRHAKLPSYPLQVRHEHVEVNEKVYLVGCPYEEASCTQNVYTGTVIQRMGGDFAFGFDPPVNLRGFSGAPVIDERGHAVGVLARWFSEPKEEDRYTDATAEGLETIL